jgi:AraC-like DNA-binding protein
MQMSKTTWESLAAEAKFCPHDLAALCNMSLRTLQRRFDEEYGLPVGQWMRNFRLSQAYTRITSGESVKVVAYDLGFKQLSHFSRVFKAAYGVPPTLVSPRARAAVLTAHQTSTVGTTAPEEAVAA